MRGSVDAVFEQAGRGTAGKRNKPGTPEAAAVTSPAAQPAPKASKPAEGGGTTEKTTGEDPRLAPYAAATARRAILSTEAMDTAEPTLVPAAGPNNLTEILADDSTAFGALETREDDNSNEDDDIVEKETRPRSLKARDVCCVVARSLICWWACTLHIAAPPGAHEHGIGMRIGGIPPPHPPPCIPPIPPHATSEGAPRLPTRVETVCRPPAAECPETPTPAGRYRSEILRETSTFGGRGSPLRRRWVSHFVSRDFVHVAIDSARETYHCGETVLRPFCPDFSLSSPRLEAAHAREVHVYGGASSPMVRRWAPHFFLRAIGRVATGSAPETYRFRDPVLRPFCPFRRRSSPRFEATPAREDHDSRGGSPPMMSRGTPTIFLCDSEHVAIVSAREMYRRVAPEFRPICPDVRFSAPRSIAPHYSETRSTTCLLECLCSGVALPQGGFEISSPIEPSSSLGRFPRVTSHYPERRPTTCLTAPTVGSVLLGKDQELSSPIGSRGFENQISRFRVEIQIRSLAQRRASSPGRVAFSGLPNVGFRVAFSGRTPPVVRLGVSISRVIPSPGIRETAHGAAEQHHGTTAERRGPDDPDVGWAVRHGLPAGTSTLRPQWRGIETGSGSGDRIEARAGSGAPHLEEQGEHPPFHDGIGGEIAAGYSQRAADRGSQHQDWPREPTGRPFQHQGVGRAGRRVTGGWQDRHLRDEREGRRPLPGRVRGSPGGWLGAERHPLRGGPSQRHPEPDPRQRPPAMAGRGEGEQGPIHLSHGDVALRAARLGGGRRHRRLGGGANPLLHAADSEGTRRLQALHLQRGRHDKDRVGRARQQVVGIHRLRRGREGCRRNRMAKSHQDTRSNNASAVCLQKGFLPEAWPQDMLQPDDMSERDGKGGLQDALRLPAPPPRDRQPRARALDRQPETLRAGGGKARPQEKEGGADCPAQRSPQRSKGGHRDQERVPLAQSREMRQDPLGLPRRPQGDRPVGDRLRVDQARSGMQDRTWMPLPGTQGLEPSQATCKPPDPRDKQWSGHVSEQKCRVHRADPWTVSASRVPRYEGYIDK